MLRGWAAIVHGDLKPNNIMLMDNGTVKVMDFGLSRRAEHPTDSANTQVGLSTEAGEITGTPSYMSPEQSRGEPVTTASDVFSLGVVLCEMLVGRKMFTGKNVVQDRQVSAPLDHKHQSA